MPDVRSLGEGVLLALDELRAHKFRSVITILGVIIGVATVMAMTAVVAGVRAQVTESLEAAGPNNFMVVRFDLNQVFRSAGHGPPWGSNPRVTPEEIRRLEALPSIRHAIADVDVVVSVDAQGRHLREVQATSNSEGWQQFTPGDYAAGRGFLASDVRAARRVAVLSKPLAAELFGTLDPVGRTVRLNGMPFEVLGVYDIAGNIFADVVKHFVVVPFTTGLKYLDAPRDLVAALLIPASGVPQGEAIDDAIAALRGMRGLRPADANDFAVVRQEEMVQTVDQVTGIFFLVMLGLSSVALLVGGVGVIAIMMISVTERTREIGVRKALGATRREILFQFLVEAATLTTIGAALGMALGAALAFLVQALTPITASVPLDAVIAALLMAAVAGVLFGLWPAWKASLMDPVEALRYE
ncbi:MAG TPA: ABC transporter permease [Longimicrobiales bacterium]|nr:ABC transporter permease [Longimicrobiales bacterium]